MQLEERIDRHGNVYWHQSPDDGNILYNDYNDKRIYFPSANITDRDHPFPECPIQDEETLRLVDTEDFDDTNDICFTYNGEKKVFTGSPTAYAKSVFKFFGITDYTVYVDGELFSLTGKRASDLNGLHLVSE